MLKLIIKLLAHLSRKSSSKICIVIIHITGKGGSLPLFSL